MREISIPNVIKYLAERGDFLRIVEALFKDVIGPLEVDTLFLLQISAENDRIHNIAQVESTSLGEEESEEQDVAKLFFNDIPFPSPLFTGVVSEYDNEDGHFAFMPVYMRNETAMYVSSRSKEPLDAEQTRVMSVITLIVQNIAGRMNFEDSLKMTHHVLENIFDIVPVGLMVIDKAQIKVNIMNTFATHSDAVQSAIGIGLKQYYANGQSSIDEIFEPETGAWFDVRFEEITWISGEKVTLATAIDVTQKVKNQQRIEYQANNDYLTGLFNRMKCERDLDMIVRESAKTGDRGVVIFLDLDNFKQVNDGLGHNYGDVLLQEVSNSLTEIPQIANSCYRMGGDEFVIIIKPSVFKEITQIVETVSNRFNMPWKLMEVEYYCTMSMGLAIFPDNGVVSTDLIKKADYAMYEAKKGGKNRYEWYAAVAPDDESDRKELEDDIKAEISGGCGNLELYYQPVVDSDGALRGAEALLRLKSDKYGLMLPETFIPIVEYLGLVSYVGDYVFEHACETLKKWNDIIPDFSMHINIASVQLMSGRAVEDFMEVIEEVGVNPDNIVLDISENAQFRDEDRAFQTLDILRAHGVKISLDDFGTGNLSLSLLRKLDAYAVKIDGSFINNAENDKYKNSVIKTICGLSKELGFKVCFEGIENEHQNSFAKSCEADLLEGFYYGDALTLERFEKEWLSNKR